MSVYSEKSPLVGNQNNNPFVKSGNNDRDLVDNGQDSMKFEQKNPRKRTLRNNVYRIMEGGWKPYDHIAAWFILFCILINLTAFILRTEDNYDKDYGTLFNFMEIFTTIVFTIEFPLRVWVCVENDRYGSKGPVKGRLKYSVRFLSLLDICSFVPFWIFLSVGWYDDESIVPITVSILRIFRLFKTERYTHTMKIVKAIVQQNREILFTYFNIVLVAFLGCSTMLYYTEKQQNPDKYKSIPDAMYNTLTFLVTQGVPTGEISTGGKWVISVGECIALVIVAIPAGLFGYGFQLFGQKLHRKRRKEQKRRSLKSLNASHDDDETAKETNLFRDTDSDEPTLKEGDRGDISNTHESAEVFFNKVTKGKENLPPSITVNGTQFVFTKYETLYFVLTSQYTISISLGISLLYRIYNIFKDYIGYLTEESIRNNIGLVYELLDEIIDFGIVQTTSTESIKLFVKNKAVLSHAQNNVSLFDTLGFLGFSSFSAPSSSANKPVIEVATEDFAIPSMTTIQALSQSIYPHAATEQTVPTQTPQAGNEIFIDVLERITAQTNNQGNIIQFQVHGGIVIKSLLQGSPKMLIELGDVCLSQRESTTDTCLDDCNYHDSVDIDKFEKSQTLELPVHQGELTVFNYRVQSGPPHTQLQSPFTSSATIETSSSFRVDIVIKLLSHFPPHQEAKVDVSCPLPSVEGITGVSCEIDNKSVAQTAEYDDLSNTVQWKIAKFGGNTLRVLRIKVYLHENNQFHTALLGRFYLNYEIPMWCCTKLKIKSVKFTNAVVDPKRWIRFTTHSNAHCVSLMNFDTLSDVVHSE